MGQVHTYKCIQCKNEIELYEGIGKMWHSFNKDMFYPPQKGKHSLNFYDEFDKKTLNKIHKFIEESEDVLVSEVCYQPYICNKCGKIESKIYFKMHDLKTGKLYRLRYTCNCGGKYIKFLCSDDEEIRCNKCGKSELKRYFKICALQTGKLPPSEFYICDCGGKYENFLSPDEEKIRCNKCGSLMIENPERFMLWD